MAQTQGQEQHQQGGQQQQQQSSTLPSDAVSGASPSDAQPAPLAQSSTQAQPRVEQSTPTPNPGPRGGGQQQGTDQTTERSGPNQTAPVGRRTTPPPGSQLRARNTGQGNNDSRIQGGGHPPTHNASTDQSASTNDNGGDSTIEPAAKPESQRGTASFETTDENVSVKLNDLNSDGDGGGSGGGKRAPEGLISS